MLLRRDGASMPDTETVSVHESDRERLKEIAEVTGKSTADVVAEFIREPTYVCPECEEVFAAEEIDGNTVEETGLMSTSMGTLVKGQREVVSFECPCCGERISPEEVRAISENEDSSGGVTRRDIGVTDENTNSKFSTEEV